MQWIRSSSQAGPMALSSAAAAALRVEGEVEYGLFEWDSPGEPSLANRQRVIRRTSRIPARLGSRFGVRYRLSGKRDGDPALTLLYLTPGVVTPDGLRHERFELVQELMPEVDQHVMSFEFFEHYQIVPGEWRFLLLHGRRKLLEQVFQVG
nr:DUF3859 domain-containing protein [Pseudomonas sp.]